ncbi:hypothetical protein K0M31_010839 [Melipona bicolor]|uniref:Uncharacterized protein n=1 Tax=Melipona bicolor TaxID=60889 RepID=A0AA40FLD8_9HYME|nr:hypothetical protein K0M31_010839 [Melipona bicolor]
MPLPIDPAEAAAAAAALVASTFPAVFTRTNLWEPLSLAAPSAQASATTSRPLGNDTPQKTDPLPQTLLAGTDDAAKPIAP